MALLHISDSALRQVINDESVFLHLDKGEYFELNATGNRMLDLLLQGNQPEDTASIITEEYDVDYDRALSDTRALIAQLVDLGIATNAATLC